MRIFLKHVFRSVRKSFAQSLLIVITLIVATATFVVSARSFFVIGENFEERKGANDYISDITVTLSSTSELRILFEDDLGDIVGSHGRVLGEFALEGLCDTGDGRELMTFYATDLERADSFYKFKFTDYGRFDTENYKKSIIISTDTAEKYGLSVGDDFSFLLLNQSFTFTVEAIALTEGPFYKCGGVFSIDAVRDVLALSNPAINSFYDGFEPYSQLRVRVNDKSKVDTVLDLIRTDERFSDKRVFKNEDEFKYVGFYNTISLTVTAIASGLVVILSSAVVSSSLDLIRKKRRGEVALFVLCGAEKRHLGTAVCLESLLYGAFGLVGGVFVARSLYEYVNNRLQFGENGVVSSTEDWLYAAAASVAVTMISTLIHLGADRKKTSYELVSGSEAQTERGRSVWPAAIVSAAFLISLAVTVILPVKDQKIASVVSMFVFLVLLFVIMPFVFRGLGWLGARALSLFGRVPPTPFMSFKNVYASHSLRHTGRLVCILAIILSTIGFAIFSVNDQVDMVENVFLCDYVAIGADEECDGLVREDESVTAAFRIGLFTDAETENGTGVICISADEGSLPYINEGLGMDALPSGGEAFVSIGVSKVCEAGVGDEITVFFGGECFTFTVARVLGVKSNFVFINAEHIGGKNDKLAIVANGDYTKDEQHLALSSVLYPRGAGFVEFDDVINESTEFAKTLIAYMELILGIAVLTTLIGVTNLVFSQHNARSHEFSVLRLSGFTRGRVLLLEVSETIVTIALAVLVAIPGAYLLSAMLDLVLNSFGADFLH